MNSTLSFFLLLLVVAGTPPGGSPPPPRHLESVAFDHQRNKLVLFGGAAVQNGALTEFTTVHE